MTEITETLAKKVLETVDYGLVRGVGIQQPGKMCVEAAVCYALGLPHGDNPPCVAPAVRSFKITLNDAQWSTHKARAKGLRRVAIAQLGSLGINQQKFVEILSLETIRKVLPITLRKAGLETNALECESSSDLSTAKFAAKNAAKNAAECAPKSAAWSAAKFAADYAAECAPKSAAWSAAESAAEYAACSGEGDEILSLSAEIAVQALIECGSEGSKFLYLADKE